MTREFIFQLHMLADGNSRYQASYRYTQWPRDVIHGTLDGPETQRFFGELESHRAWQIKDFPGAGLPYFNFGRAYQMDLMFGGQRHNISHSGSTAPDPEPDLQFLTWVDTRSLVARVEARLEATVKAKAKKPSS